MSTLRNALAVTRTRIARARTLKTDTPEDLTPIGQVLSECDMRDPYARALMHALNSCDDSPFDGACFALDQGTL